MIKLYKDFSVMKGAVRISMLLITLACLVSLSSCGDDDDKKKKKSPKNQIKVDGKTFDFTKGYIVSEQITDGDDVIGSAHWVFLTGDGLELDDELVVSGEGHFVAMYIGAEDNNDLIADEYDMDYLEYDFGNVIFFDLYENYAFDDDVEDFVYDAWYSGNDDGTVTVSTSADAHIFNIDLEEYYFLGDSEDEETEDLISEALTGYFKGELEEITVSDEGSRRKLSALRKSRKVN